MRDVFLTEPDSTNVSHRSCLLFQSDVLGLMLIRPVVLNNLGLEPATDFFEISVTSPFILSSCESESGNICIVVCRPPYLREIEKNSQVT